MRIDKKTNRSRSEMIQILHLLLMLVASVQCAENIFISTQFHRVTDANSTSTSHISAQPYEVKTTDGKIECALVCSREDSCMMFDYSGGMCHMYNLYTDSISDELMDAWHIDFMDCDEAQNRRNITDSYASVNGTMVECKLSTSPLPSDNGGTVIQRRVDGDVDFNKPWDDYVNGFGDTQELWIGLETIHQLTQSPVRLSIYMERMDGNGIEWANYSSFSVGDASTNYTLSIEGDFSGTQIDDFISSMNDDMEFTTHDRDNDMEDGYNCVGPSWMRGAWWHSWCSDTNLNGKYGVQDYSGIWWAEAIGGEFFIKTVIMTIYTN